AVLQMLNLLEGFDLRALGPQSPDYWHLFLEAKKLAYADRARYLADPAFARVPTAELISKSYASHRRQLIDLRKALTLVEAGDPRVGHSDTVYLCVADQQGNCVSLIQSNWHNFGSGLVPGGLGFALQNRGALFALDEGHANRLEPHRRPFHTILPALVPRGGRPGLDFGVMSGGMQPHGQVKGLGKLIDFDIGVQQAEEAAVMQKVRQT